MAVVLMSELKPRLYAPGFDCTGPHLYVIQGDMETLRADAHLVPTGNGLHIRHYWHFLFKEQKVPRLSEPQIDEVRNSWATIIQGARGPIVLANTAFSGSATVGEALAWMRQGLYAGLNALQCEISEGRVLVNASAGRPLLAIPLLGTQGGGLERYRGGVVRAILDAVSEFCDDQPDAMFDIVLVCRQSRDYAAVQAERRRRTPEQEDSWLMPAVKAARAGQLGLLFGAGSSTSLGVPQWADLLKALAAQFGLEGIGEKLADVDPTDAASLLRDAASTSEAFDEALADLVDVKECSLMHAIMANIRPSIAITTNFDVGYELAVSAMQETVAVLPWRRPTSPTEQCLLKLHGDVANGSVVLSRDDFVLMQAHRRPLGSLLQERMMVGHLLVVGSSMSDPTLVQAAEEVSSLIRKITALPSVSEPHGTVVLTRDQPVRRTILERSFTVAVAGDADGSFEDGARRVLMLLDRVAMRADRNLSYLLDPAYDDLITDKEMRRVVEAARMLGGIVESSDSDTAETAEFKASILRGLSRF